MTEPRMTLAYSQDATECGCCGAVFEGYGRLCDDCWQSGCSSADDGRPCFVGGDA